MKYLKSILLVMMPFLASAQQNFTEEVKLMFDDTAHLEWINNYAGYIDNMTKVETSLGFDGTYCKGIIYYPSSGFSTEISGTAIGNRLQLNEISADGLITGKLSGTITKDKLIARWSNHNNTIGCNYSLKNEEELTKSIKKENDDKWVRWYVGKVSDEVLHVILHKKSENEIYGSCYNETGTKSYKVTGTLSDDKTIKLKFLLGEHVMATFSGNMSKRKLIKGQVTGIGMINEDLLLHLDNKINYQQISFQSFSTSYEILLPEYGSKDFDKFIKNSTSDWLKECIDKSNSKSYKESDIPLPEERLINRGYIYPDIRYVADNVISGHMIFVNTWTGQTKTKPINYNLKEDEEIKLDQLFNKELSYRDSLISYLKSNGKSAFNFQYFNITPEGLRLYDEFEPINGRNDFIVPYSVLKPWAKKTGPLKKIL